MKMGKIIPVFAFAAFTCMSAIANPAFLLEAESPSMLKNAFFCITEVAGYEGGYIPDLLSRSYLEMGLFGFIQLGGNVGVTYLMDQNLLALTEFEVVPKLRLFSWGKGSMVTAYLKYKQILPPSFYMVYTGPSEDVLLVVNPHTDTGMDFTAGLNGVFQIHPFGWTLLCDANYSRTEGRTYYYIFDTEPYKNRIFGTITPAYYKPDSLMIGVQNRVMYWFDRGFSYEIMPQINWVFAKGWTLTAGGTIPVFAGNSFRAYLGLSVEFGFKPGPTETLAIIKEGENIRIRIDFNFLGDESDLFRPKNAQYGDQNRRLMDKVIAYLKKYPDFQIVIEGHTSRSNFKLTFNEEQKSYMYPLAVARANEVKNQLVNAGFGRSRITTIAYGGLRPLAKFTDTQNTWKNRRVEILLVKKKGK